MFKVTGKTNVFFTKKNTSDGTLIVEGSTSIEKTDKNGITVDRMYYEVIFGKENFPKEVLTKLEEDTCYTIEIEDGWITFRSYENKGGYLVKVPQLFIKKAHILSAKKVDVAKKESAKKARRAQGSPKAKDSPLEASESQQLPF